MDSNIWQPLAGLGLFLFAMQLVEESLETVSGRAFRSFIRRYTNQPLQGIAAGTLAAGVLQSSSLVGLMTLALVGSGVMRLRNALGIIFGANLGTTLTGWIVATLGFKLDLDAAALPLIGIGGVLAIALTAVRLRAYARFLLGIGLLLMGLSLMKTAIGDIGGRIDPQWLAELTAVEFLLFGMLFSAVIQSSSATMMVTLTALHAGIIDLPAAAAVAIGADLGTTATLLIGAIKGNAAKKRLAAGHFLFNLIIDLLAFVFRVPLLAIVGWFGLSDLLSLVAFHSLFNLFGILLFLPFVSKFAGFLERLFIEKSSRTARHLSPETLNDAQTGVEAVTLETGRLLKRVLEQNLRAFHPHLHPALHALPIDGLPTESVLGSEDAQFLDAYERSKRLEGEILAFSTDLQALTLSPEQSAAVSRCQQVARDGIHSSKNLKDVQADLKTVSDHPDEALLAYDYLFRNAQATFYENLLTIKRSQSHLISAEDFAHLESLRLALHDELHRKIYADVKNDLIDEQQISLLLNVNRELHNSNQATALALAEYLLEPTDIESLELAGQRN